VRALSLAALPALALLVYLNSLGGGFVWDDRFLVLNNPRVQSLHHLGDLLTSDYVFVAETDLAYGYFRPLASLSLVADWAIWGADPRGFHLTNVLLHAAATLLAALLAARLGLDRAAAWAVGALFAVHPIHTESVAWIAGRTDVLAFLLAAASFVVHLGPAGDARGTRGARWRESAAVALFGLALLAKEMAAVLPLWIAAWEWLREPARQHRARRALRATAPYFALLGAYAWTRFVWLEVPAPAPPAEHALLPALLTLPSTLVRYLGWMAAPFDLRAYVQNPYVARLAEPRFGGALAVLAVVAWAILRLARRQPRAIGLGALLVLSFAPIANFARLAGPADMGAPMAERFGYLPSFPFLALAVLAAGAGLASAFPVPARGRIAAVLLAALIAAGAAQTWARNRDWRDDVTLFAREAARTPAAPLLWINLAQAQLRTGHAVEADASLRRAEALEPSSLGVQAARAQWLVFAGRTEEALPLQRRVVRGSEGKNAVARANLAYLLRVTGRLDEARPILEELIARLPDYPAPALNLAELHRARGAWAEAARAYRVYLDLQPDDARAREGLAAVEVAQGHPERAEEAYLAGLRGRPADARLLNNLGLVRLGAGNLPGALEALESATRADPRYAKARFNLASVLARAGRTQESRHLLESLIAEGAGGASAAAAATLLETLPDDGATAVPLAPRSPEKAEIPE
jgi:tetratricopeptide (TPR) repeat protein